MAFEQACANRGEIITKVSLSGLLAVERSKTCSNFARRVKSGCSPLTLR
jgi:hypothetical protein